MIVLADISTCCGCAACEAVCPTNSITMREDKEGFLHPNIDNDTCISCHKCEKTCPVITYKPALTDTTTQAYAAQLKNKDELLEVSSGGAFWGLAQSMLDKGGVIYGAAQIGIDEVKHVRVDNIFDATKLRRSKYLPSSIDGVYEKVKTDLDSGTLVLFSGVGCQIAGLLAFLHKKYDNLITCDVVCHGIPSKHVWSAYRNEKEKNENRKIVDVVFRDKSMGWKNNQYKITFDDGGVEYCSSTMHPFHRGYLHGLFNRPSCASCQFATLQRPSDISLADYWQYNGDKLDSTNGVSLIITHSSKGETWLNQAEKYLEYETTTLDAAVASCRHLTHAPSQHAKREVFFSMLNKYGYNKAMTKCLIEQDRTLTKQLKKVFRLSKKAISYSCKKTQREDRQVIKQYYSDLSQKAVFAESFWESWRVILCRHRVLVTSNKIIRKLARACKIKNIVDPKNITTIAQQYAALKEALLLLHYKNVPVYFYHRVGKEDDYQYSASGLHRMKNDLSFPKMHGNIDCYMSEFKELIGSDVTKEYIEDLGKITQIIKKGKYLCHEDTTSTCVNIVEGKRVTAYQPNNNKRTLHIYGRCGAFGYAVEDKDTLPSQLQWFLNQSGLDDIKVVNHGLWGGADKNIDHNFLLDMLGMKEGDIVLFYRHRLDSHFMTQFEQRGMWYRDITHEWHQYPEAAWCYYNYPGHMCAIGYRNVAEIICKDLINHGFRGRTLDERFTNDKPKSDYINYYLKKHAHNEVFDNEIAQYIQQIKQQYPIDDTAKCGAIVMNCNPFTLGHRYLIEKAASSVERLYIFVVEEDKSFFRFKDRFEMVMNGTAGLKNVCIVPSGNFIISAFTFPEYFMKDYVKEKEFDMSSDVEIFGSKIAPALHITKRFAGEEPFDVVTKKYNETMNEVLPRYGIEFVEIPRLATEDKTIINATLVRHLLKEKNFHEISKFVPDSTLHILKARYTSF